MTHRFGGSTEPSALAVRGQSGRVERAARAAAELQAALEAAATADERERIAAIIAELAGGAGSITDMAERALGDTHSGAANGPARLPSSPGSLAAPPLAERGR